ncbi:MAG: hypothetical protein GX259_03640, partial [Bacteroidales bacterium]|nr:hypothetical protein [Bacteroidales bacterium]
MNLRRFFLAFFSFILIISANAQLVNPVKWDIRSNKISDTEANIVLTATIDNGWHLYSQYNPAGASLPLTFTIKKTNNFSTFGKVAEYPKPTEKFEELFNVTEKFFSNTATFTQRIKVISKNKFTVDINLSGQACKDDGVCVPLDEDLSIDIDGSKYNLEITADTSTSSDSLALTSDTDNNSDS